MEKSDRFEYTCSNCNATVTENDKICPQCCADLSEEVHPLKYDKTKFRVLFYLLMNVILWPVVAAIIFLLLTWIIEIFNLPDVLLIRRYTPVISFIPSLITSMAFTFLFIERSRSIKIKIAFAITLSQMIVYGLITYLNLNSLIFLFAFVTIQELAYNYFNKRYYKILIPAAIILLIYLVRFRVGDLPREIIDNDLKTYMKQNSINYKEYFPFGRTDQDKYDKSIQYYVFTDKDTMAFILNYNLVSKSFYLSPEWKFINIIRVMTFFEEHNINLHKHQ
jgi:hypothetical protein